MYSQQPHVGRAYGLSVFTGALVGTALLTLQAVDRDSLSELWALPLIIVASSLFALPFVALGLAVFGLPVTALLKSKSDEWWVGAIAALWGGLSGKLMLWLMGSYNIAADSVVDIGSIYGLPTGLAWWSFYRRQFGTALSG